MTVNEIVERLGREKRVEQIVLRISGLSTLTADLQDLCQMIYLTLLEYDADKLGNLWESDAINFLIVRLVQFNLHSKTSRYYYTIKIFKARSSDIDEYREGNGE